jgi:hypothetical protein
MVELAVEIGLPIVVTPDCATSNSTVPVEEATEKILPVVEAVCTLK